MDERVDAVARAVGSARSAFGTAARRPAARAVASPDRGPVDAGRLVDAVTAGHQRRGPAGAGRIRRASYSAVPDASARQSLVRTRTTDRVVRRAFADQGAIGAPPNGATLVENPARTAGRVAVNPLVIYDAEGRALIYASGANFVVPIVAGENDEGLDDEARWAVIRADGETDHFLNDQGARIGEAPPVVEPPAPPARTAIAAGQWHDTEYAIRHANSASYALVIDSHQKKHAPSWPGNYGGGKGSKFPEGWTNDDVIAYAELIAPQIVAGLGPISPAATTTLRNFDVAVRYEPPPRSPDGRKKPQSPPAVARVTINSAVWNVRNRSWSFHFYPA